MALLARCNAIIATDSGPMHVASSLSVPILCLYGPTAPEGAYGSGHAWVRHESLPCLVCNRLRCPIAGHPCMSELPVGRVLETFERLRRERRVQTLR
jgi:ADP-heptose:LPS heptosyltransferase